MYIKIVKQHKDYPGLEVDIVSKIPAPHAKKMLKKGVAEEITKDEFQEIRTANAIKRKDGETKKAVTKRATSKKTTSTKRTAKKTTTKKTATAKKPAGEDASNGSGGEGS